MSSDRKPTFYRIPRSNGFDVAAAEFTQSLRRAANWREVYGGESYAERVGHAIDEARSACDRMAYILLQEKQA